MTRDVTKPERLCNPANRSGLDPTAPTHPDHLKGYKIKAPKGAPKFTKLVARDFIDVYGALTVDVVKPARLLVPSLQSLMSPQPGTPTFPLVDNFDCYKVKVTRGTTPFTAVPGVTIADQFGQPLTITVTKPTMLCAPANRANTEPGAETHPDHLMCYKIKIPRGAPKFVKVSPVLVTDELVPQSFDAIKPQELCVPAVEVP